MVRVLVTGGGGFAGRHLLQALLRVPEVELFSTIATGAEPAQPTPELAQVNWIELDLLSPESVEASIRGVLPDQIYHLAGQASVRDSFADPLTTWDVNATGTLRLLQALTANPSRTGNRPRLLLVSSAEVYGEVSLDAQPTVEDTPIAPITPYGSSKAAAEIAALQMGRTGSVEVVIARSFNHIGPGQDDRFVLAGIARQLAAIKRSNVPTPILVGNLEVERDFLDVRDVAQAYITLMSAASAQQTYNVCSGETFSLAEVVQRLVLLSGAAARVEVDAARFRPADIPRLVGDGSRLRALGWSPEFDLDSTLRDLLADAASRL